MQDMNHDYYIKRESNANMDEFSSLRLDLRDQLKSVRETSRNKQDHSYVQG